MRAGLVRRAAALAEIAPHGRFVRLIHDTVSGHLKYVKPTGDIVDLESPSVNPDGVAGGQTVRGGTAAGEHLSLLSTAHAIRGHVKADGRPVLTYPFELIQPQVSGNLAGQIGVGVGVANSMTGCADASDTSGMWQSVPVSAAAKTLRGQPRLVSPGVVECLIKTPSDLTNCVIYVGFAANNFTTGADPSNNFAGTVYRASADATHWEAVSRDGSTTNNAGDVASIATSTVYRVRVRTNGTNYYVSVNGSAEVTLSSNLPTVATGAALGIVSTLGSRTAYWSWLARFFDMPSGAP